MTPGAPDYTFSLQIVVILLAGIIGAKVSEKARLPTVIPLIIAGYLIGPYSPIGLSIFDPLRLGISIETIASMLLPLILFYGGLSFNLEAFRRTYKAILALATLGVVISAVLMALVGHYLLSMDVTSSLLIGTAVAATDIAAVKSVLEGIYVKSEVMATLVGESAFNDATVMVLVGILLSLARAGTLNPLTAAMEFLRQFVGGILLGYTIGMLVGGLMSRFKLEEYTTYFSLLAFLATYTTAAFVLTANPAVAVVVSGMVFRGFITRGGVVISEGVHTLSFWENVVFLAEVVIFMALGASISIVGLPAELPASLVMLAIAVLVARPAAVFISTVGSRQFTAGEKLFMSLMGARGSVSAGLANVILVSGLPYARTCFNVILMVTVASLLIVGLGGRHFARYMCEDHASPSIRIYEALRAEYLAAQEALRELNRRYSEGVLDIETFTQLENELKGELARIEKRLAEIYEDEEMKRMRMMEFLEEKRSMLLTKLRYLRHLRSHGEVSEAVYRGLSAKYRAELRKVEEELMRMAGREEKKRWPRFLTPGA